ncbi:MAG: hypothetical protein ACOCRK_08340 [bacterium]
MNYWTIIVSLVSTLFGTLKIISIYKSNSFDRLFYSWEKKALYGIIMVCWIAFFKFLVVICLYSFKFPSWSSEGFFIMFFIIMSLYVLIIYLKKHNYIKKLSNYNVEYYFFTAYFIILILFIHSLIYEYIKDMGEEIINKSVMSVQIVILVIMLSVILSILTFSLSLLIKKEENYFIIDSDNNKTKWYILYKLNKNQILLGETSNVETCKIRRTINNDGLNNYTIHKEEKNSEKDSKYEINN